ncbi:2-phospho-L-lactate guanylyltransferase [Nocardioides sp. Kera G14]|uniref:2-phospho-L-lactate guanylyltransferase n=1 Tax=Nocardioides sp. Kera G14 TaxID=2884264 RepID=UPI001D108A3F|nr:2-phospho-L-lactate guanylyltransferase [Nocardioides sp. Kera G14]UDY22691.1 2-phospho-L-lactate guanylyltransferase [Nocardioides sp. Kera G14]
MPSHVVLLPVKPPARGKSRLVGVSDAVRRSLAEAFALDTAAACLAAPSVGAVLAVTDDADFSRQLIALGCAAIPDGVSDDLNGSLVQAAAEAARRWPDLIPAALCGDLPALSPTDLDAALTMAIPLVEQGIPAYVADAVGLGTTLFTAPRERFAPRFGLNSRMLHDEIGAVPIEGELATLRRDVDDLDDLEAAAQLGLGIRTSAVLREMNRETQNGPSPQG